MRFRVWAAILCTSFAVILIAPFFGAEPTSVRHLFDSQSIEFRILWELRVPRVAFVALCGGGLAILGATYQVLFRNPLAEPYVLGTSTAVTLGVVFAEVFLKFSSYTVEALGTGFLFALSVTSLLMALTFTRVGKEVERIILFGMGMNFVLSSVLFLLLSFYYQHMGGGSLRWLFGHIPWVGFRDVGWLAIVSVPCMILLFILSRHLDALSLGDSVARTLGVSPFRSRFILLALTCVFLSFIVCLTGAIGFVGLVVPHIVRLCVAPSSTRTLLGISLPLGAVFLVISDLVSRVILPPFEFPIGIITTIVGGPLFLILLWKR
ncbi:MAG: iron ABC transporter permease [Deltaproteobacteria bacterium]|nr:iron ABC transporter permease [Deltaproteobacteria bacterium]